MAFITTNIEAENVIQAMCDDVGFMIDIFDEITDGFIQGLLLDNAVDAASDWKHYDLFKNRMLEFFEFVDLRKG